MDFQELGLTLKSERERRGLTIEAVMEATKISRTNIVAMEEGNRSMLPHPVYAKGFVKSYARFLGLDPDELSMAVDQEYQDEADGPEEHIYEVSPAAEKAFQGADASETKKSAKWPLMLVIVFVVVVGGLLAMNLRGNKEEAQNEVASEEVVEQEQPVVPAPEPIEEQVAAEAEEVATDAVEATEEATESAVAAEDAAAAEESAAPAADKPAPAPEPVAETTPAPQPEKKPEPVVEKAPEKPAVEQEQPEFAHNLVIRATTEKGCWIGVWKGDAAKLSRDFVLKQGEPLRLKFNTPRRIRIGNAAGVTVIYNGEPFPLNDAKGNIQTLRFGME